LPSLKQFGGGKLKTIIMPISVKKYNENQLKEYKIYCAECLENGVEPRGQNRYHAPIDVNYGFVVEQQCNGIMWKKNKKDFY